MAEFQTLHQGAHRRVSIMSSGAERVRETFVTYPFLFGDPSQTLSAPQGFFERDARGARVAEGFASVWQSFSAMKASWGEDKVKKVQRHFSILHFCALDEILSLKV